MSKYKLGKKPARPQAVTFALAQYLKPKVELPTPPKVFGDQRLVRGGWKMLGNADYCDCVWAGAAHETMLWKSQSRHKVTFNDRAVLSDYARVTKFNPLLPESDEGTDMKDAASYRRKTGIVDARGKRHKIVAYLALPPKNIEQLALAIYLFGAVGIGLKMPNTAEGQFDRRKPWSVVKGSRVTGGHYVSGVGRDKDGNILIVSWGRIQRMTPQFYKRYNDEVVAYVSAEALRKGKARNGIKRKQLLDDLKAIGQ